MGKIAVALVYLGTIAMWFALIMNDKMQAPDDNSTFFWVGIAGVLAVSMFGD